MIVKARFYVNNLRVLRKKRGSWDQLTGHLRPIVETEISTVVLYDTLTVLSGQRLGRPSPLLRTAADGADC